MRPVAIVLCAVILLASLAVAFGGSRGSKQVQFAPQAVRVINSPEENGWIPVANDRNHALYVTGQPAPPVSYAFSVQVFTPPTTTASGDSQPKVDETRLAPALESFLNQHPDWEPVSVPSKFEVGVNLVVFRHRK